MTRIIEILDRDGKLFQTYEVDENNIKNGNLYEYDEKGVILKHEQYKNGKLHGKSIEWNDVGTKVCETDYENDVKNGVESEWYDTGIEKSVCELRDGALNGMFHTWYATGLKCTECCFKNRIIVGKMLTWHANGTLAACHNYNDVGHHSGRCTNYSEAGIMTHDKYYLDDLLHGLSISYHVDGSVYVEANYINGSFDGIHRVYRPNGNMESEVTYSLGMRNGSFKTFNSIGGLFEECEYVNDKKHGVYKEYHDTGRLRCHLLYEHGTIEQIIEMYDELERDLILDDGEIHVWYTSIVDDKWMFVKLKVPTSARRVTCWFGAGDCAKIERGVVSEIVDAENNNYASCRLLKFGTVEIGSTIDSDYFDDDISSSSGSITVHKYRC